MQDASAVLDQIVGGLEGLAAETMRVIGEDRTFLEMWGWNCPVMNRHEFSTMIRRPVARIQNIKNKPFEDSDFATLQQIPTQIEQIRTQSLPNLPGGNAFHVYLVVESLVSKIFDVVDKYALPEIEWDDLENKNIVPVELIKRLRSLENDISGMFERSKGIGKKNRGGKFGRIDNEEPA